MTLFGVILVVKYIALWQWHSNWL